MRTNYPNMYIIRALYIEVNKLTSVFLRHGVLAVEGAATDPDEDFSGEERMEQEVGSKITLQCL